MSVRHWIRRHVPWALQRDRHAAFVARRAEDRQTDDSFIEAISPSLTNDQCGLALFVRRRVAEQACVSADMLHAADATAEIDALIGPICFSDMLLVVPEGLDGLQLRFDLEDEMGIHFSRPQSDFLMSSWVDDSQSLGDWAVALLDHVRR